jgi:hypothetical protein
MDPYLGLGQNLSGLYFLIFLLFFPLGGPIEKLMYDSYIHITTRENLLFFYFNRDFFLNLKKICLYI